MSDEEHCLVQELDEAARRRMPKQLYIPLPCEAARESMLRRQLGPGCGVQAELPDSDIAKIVVKTNGYSGSDMRNLIQEASQVCYTILVYWMALSQRRTVPILLHRTCCNIL